jgi:hypothetical protein
MGNKMLFYSAALGSAREQFELFDHFTAYNDADLWTKLASDTNATVAHEGPGRSRVAIFTGDAVKNNEACFATTHELFKYVANKAIVGEGKIQYAESATDDAKVAFGFADAIAANSITDAGAIAATDAAIIWKTEDSTVWRFHTEINGTSTASVSTTTAGGSSAQVLRIEALPVSATVYEVRPFCDGVQLKDSNGLPIMHRVTLGTATDMDFGVYVKAGAGTSGQETVYVDYLYAAQVI